jgi:hypothetical protein
LLQAGSSKQAGGFLGAWLEHDVMSMDKFKKSEKKLGGKDWLGRGQGVDQLSYLYRDGILRWETTKT